MHIKSKVTTNKTFSLIDYHIHIDIISMLVSILYFKGLCIQTSYIDVDMSMEIIFIIANNAGHNAMPPYVAFYLGIYYSQGTRLPSHLPTRFIDLKL